MGNRLFLFGLLYIIVLLGLRFSGIIGNIELVGILVGSYFIYQSVSMVAKKDEDVKTLLFWMLLGTTFITVSIFRDFFAVFILSVQMEQRSFFVFSIAIFISFLMIFNISKQLREQKKQISLLNENISILIYKKSRKKR